MGLPKVFIARLEFIHPKDIFELLQGKDRPKTAVRWILKNEVRPVDLYCYLGARFGKPNGIQNFLRKDDSANLIHWEWFLRYGKGFITIYGMNFRTEVWISGVDVAETDRDEFVGQLKAEFAQFGPAMGKVRKPLEHWMEFVNPYQRLRQAVTRLMEELSSLGVDAKRDRISDITDEKNHGEEVQAKWKEQGDKYSRAIGLCFGVSSMLPVMAEAFVNLLLYILMKPELRKDERLRENVIRQPIDICIRSLSHNCVGFNKPVDFSNEACKRYHSLVNERNDLLHGNVVIENLRFNELYFYGKVPIFVQYSSMWERSFGVIHRSVGLDSIKEELTIVDGLVQYLLSCLDERVREEVQFMSDKFDLGVCLDDGRLGVLFPDWLIDFAPVFRADEPSM